MNGRPDEQVLVLLASGIGNIVLATPLLRVLDRAGFAVDVLLDADYPGVSELLEGWSVVRCVYDGRYTSISHQSYAATLIAVPPFYWARYAPRYSRAGITPYRPPDEMFFRNEQAYYLDFARSLGCDVSDPPYYFLPVTPRSDLMSCSTTLVLAPGCKTGQMAAKRWPFFPELAERFDDVVIVGTDDDLLKFDGGPFRFADRVRSFAGQLSLRETAVVLAGAGAVVSNDCGLGHIAGALGVPTILLFGPTPDATLGPLPPNVTVMRSGLGCEPCWLGARFRSCSRRIDCLNTLGVDAVVAALGDRVPSRKCKPL